MQLTCKTVQGKSFTIEVNPDDKVVDVKGKILAEQGENYAVASQVLIHKGKVLKDDTTLADNDVTEAGFLVVMVTKTAKPAPAPAAPPAAAAPAPAPDAPAPAAAAAAAPAAPVAAPASAPAAADAPAPAAAAPAALGGASELLVGSALESRIDQICEMGFEREQVMRAMRAAYNNSERAVEYLMTGIPETAEPEVPQAPAGGAPGGGAAAAAAAGPQPLDMFGGGGGAPGAAGAGGGPGSLDFLRSNSQFQMLRQLVQANPQILQPMLQELGKQNPQLLQLINSNQQEFLRLIGEAPAQGEAADLAAQLGEMVGGMEEDEGQGMPVVNLTEEEVQAIERLEALGFPRDLCVEAFLACDKNEEAAANYLFDNAAEDMQ